MFRLSERVGHNLSAPILGRATNFRAAIKGWDTKSAHTKYMIFQAPPPPPPFTLLPVLSPWRESNPRMSNNV